MRVSSVFFSIFVLFIASVSAASVEVARVNDRPITNKDMEHALQGYNEGQKKSILSDRNSRRQILQGLIDQELLVQKGEKEKLDQAQEFKDALTAFRRQYFAEVLFQRDVDSKISNSVLKKHYDLYKNRYSTDQFHVQHILVSDEEGAKEILKKAKDPNADFQDLAEKASKDPSVKNNRGDLGFVHLNSPYVQEFKDAVFSGSTGDFIGPIKTAYGYHIIKIVEKKLGKPLGFDEVELRVKSELLRIMRENYVGKLKADAAIKVDDKALDKM